MKIKSMKDLYIDLLRDMYSGEQQLTKALPKMAEHAISDDLKAVFQSHLGETKQQVERLEKVFKELGEKPTGEECEAMKGLISEAEELMSADISRNIVDAALIASAQKVEHYEIGSYGTLCAFARELGLNAQEKFLRETLEEEKAADRKLTAIAEKHVNQDAMKQAA